MQHKTAGRCIVMLLCIFLTCPRVCRSDDFSFSPSLRITRGYNNNIFFDDSMNDTLSDSTTTVSPGFALRERTERFDSHITGYLDWISYRDNDSLDATDKTLLADMAYQCTPRTGLSANSSYKQNSNPDRDLATTGLITGTSRRNTISYSMSFNHRMSELWSADISYAGQRNDYEDSDSVDSASQGVRLSVGRDINDMIPRTTFMMDFTCYDYRYQDSTVERTDNYACSLGGRTRLSETCDISFGLGYRYTTTIFDIPEWMSIFYDQESTSGGGTGQFVFTYNGEKSTSTLRISHDISNASGISSVTKRSSISYDIRKSFKREFSLDLGAYLYINRARQGEFSDEDIDQRTLYILPAVLYAPNNGFCMKMYYSYAYVRDLEDKTTRRRSLFGIQFTCRSQLFD